MFGLQFYGSSMNGGFSSHVIAKAEQAVPYGKADAAFAATACCSGITTFSAIKKLGRIADHERILFIGAGGLGLMALQLFKTLHPTHPGPVFADIDQARLDLTLKLGASGVINLKTDRKVLSEASKGMGRPPLNFYSPTSRISIQEICCHLVVVLLDVFSLQHGRGLHGSD